MMSRSATHYRGASVWSMIHGGSPTLWTMKWIEKGPWRAEAVRYRRSLRTTDIGAGLSLGLRVTGGGRQFHDEVGGDDERNGVAHDHGEVRVARVNGECYSRDDHAYGHPEVGDRPLKRTDTYAFLTDTEAR